MSKQSEMGKLLTFPSGRVALPGSQRAANLVEQDLSAELERIDQALSYLERAAAVALRLENWIAAREIGASLDTLKLEARALHAVVARNAPGSEAEEKALRVLLRMSGRYVDVKRRVETTDGEAS